MERIYHHYKFWEDHKEGFYNSCSGSEKKEKLDKAVEMFSNAKLTKDNMFRVTDEWTYSCEVNLSNAAMNKIAYIGQAACCIYASIPSTITMEAWSLVDKDSQDRANKIAKEVLNMWLNKNIQLCLSID